MRILLRTRAFLVTAALYAAVSIAASFAPLLGIVGYPNALLANLLIGTLGFAPALAAARVEGRIEALRPTAEIPFELCRPAGRLHAVLLPAASATIVLTGLVLLGFGVAWLNGLRVGSCDLWAGSRWYLVLPLPSAALVSSVGVAIGAFVPWRWLRVVSVVGILTLSLVVTVWPILVGPQAFAFHHLLGWVPGPLYDERVSVGLPVLAYRGMTLLWTALLLGATAFGLPGGNTSAGRPARRRIRAAMVVALASGGIGLMQWQRNALGFQQSFASVAAALGGELRTEHFLIHYPKERDDRWVRLTGEDHEFQYRRLVAWLELGERTTPLHSYVFRNAAEKAKLTGAGRTSIAKPWQGAFYLNDRAHPHPVLKHELLHALAADFGAGPFRVSTHNGLVVNAGFEEGLAVAADWRYDDLTVHEWARAMRDTGVAPDVRGLFTAAGFWKHSSGRAYTLAGSFLRFLVDERGIDQVKIAYAAGDLRAIADPEDLFVAWEEFLDEMPSSPRARRLAEHRFRRPSIFRRPCAFDVADARKKAHVALRAGRHEEALSWFERCRELEPQDPGHLKGIMDVHFRAGDPVAARAVADELLAHANTSAKLRTDVYMALGDQAWRAEDYDEALDHFEAVIDESSDRGTLRLAAAKIISTQDPGLTDTLRPFFLKEIPANQNMLRLRELLDARPDAGFAAYLLGRQLFNGRTWDRALGYLEQARSLGMPQAAGLALENQRLIARARYEAGELDVARNEWTLFGTRSESPSDRLQAEDWIARIDFLLATAAQ